MSPLYTHTLHLQVLQAGQGYQQNSPSQEVILSNSLQQNVPFND